MGWQHPQKSCESLPIAPPELITSHPHACQVPICVSPALGPPLMTCCSSFMKCSLEQFYTSFDLCSGMHPPSHTPPPHTHSHSPGGMRMLPTHPSFPRARLPCRRASAGRLWLLKGL